jgi:MerR family transcriptional regulator, light-induced transcriptional regulator
MDDGYLRIGEFSERVGVSADLLRAWERRYGLIDPDRSTGGFRLYSDADAARVRRMVALLDQGVSPAEAARLAQDGAGATSPVAVEGDGSRLAAGVARFTDALDAFDDAAAHAVLDEHLASFALETVLRDLIVPALRAIGDRWAAGELTVGQEHFASALIRGRLLAMARGWGSGSGPGLLLAAPPGEEHDLGLIVFGLVAWRRGWRVTFLGADTPVDAMVEAIRSVEPRLVVLSAHRTDSLLGLESDLRAIAEEVAMAIGGAGADGEVADRIGVEVLATDPVTAAEGLDGR